MNTLEAYARSQSSQGNRLRVFDWEKAARLILEKNPKEASAGLRGDWEWTGGTIYSNGKPDMDSYTFLGSTWAIPEIDIDGQVEECWRYKDETPGWGSKTKWPESAILILKKSSTSIEAAS